MSTNQVPKKLVTTPNNLEQSTIKVNPLLHHAHALSQESIHMLAPSYLGQVFTHTSNTLKIYKWNSQHLSLATYTTLLGITP